MPIYLLACYCRAFDLNFFEFRELSGKREAEVLAYILQSKEFKDNVFEKKKRKLEAALKHIDPSQVLYPGHPFYPQEFYLIHQPPVFLLFEGPAEILLSPKIAVVGTRRPEERFLVWLDTELKIFLQKTQSAVVSGGARGIDQKASQIALRTGTPSIVVLPSGLGCKYPKGLSQILNGESLVFLSEYFPFEEMQKGHFVRRNRLISSLGAFLLAVQFEVKSGTMITVNYGLSQNKEIATLPDHPLSGLSSGNLKLIREGAHVIGSAEDLIGLWTSTHVASNASIYCASELFGGQ